MDRVEARRLVKSVFKNKAAGRNGQGLPGRFEAVLAD
jgi:hypothetical protein